VILANVCLQKKRMIFNYLGYIVVESLLKYAVSRAGSIHLLRGTVRAKVRSRTSVEAFPKTGKSPTRPVV